MHLKSALQIDASNVLSMPTLANAHFFLLACVVQKWKPSSTSIKWKIDSGAHEQHPHLRRSSSAASAAVGLRPAPHSPLLPLLPVGPVERL